MGEVLSKRERDDLNDQKRELEETLKEPVQYDAQRHVDRSNITQKITNIDRQIVTGTPQKMESVEKDRNWARIKELERDISHGMPTDSEMKGRMLKGGGREPYPGMVGRHIAWTKENKDRVSEYKQIMRKLDPNNPNAGNVELLRKR